MDYTALHRDLSNHVFPICEMDTNKHSFIGTSILCKYAGKKIIINAGHTIDDYFSKNIKLALYFDKKYIYISPLTTKSCYNNLGMDVAFTIIDDNIDIPEENFINLNNLFKENIQELTHIVFFGYPASAYSPYSKNPHAEFIRYTSEIVNIKNIIKLCPKIDPNYHIVGKLITEDVLYVKENKEIIKPKMPSLKGLSGGPVFGINQHNQSILCFVGIGIRCYEREKYLVALKHNCINAALNKFISEMSRKSGE